jgi:hypothetical protein
MERTMFASGTALHWHCTGTALTLALHWHNSHARDAAPPGPAGRRSADVIT